ncbi:hypothetical protein KPH14_001458 [Odynerus spinipes]|uniref:Uncharacterized protein n=1 Tax=Odynerus spinipes TaxID=1348599 RepID=A0AAD9RUI4_9HYME|nr:hypothetical protein KPH14_001458 [Odynerus spinipes]
MQMRITQRFNRECGYGTRNESTSKNKPGRVGIVAAAGCFTNTTAPLWENNNNEEKGGEGETVVKLVATEGSRYLGRN